MRMFDSMRRMYQSNLDEQLVMAKTGHHSNCVHSFKHTSSAQLQNVHEVFCGNASSTPSVFEPMVKKPCIETAKGKTKPIRIM